MSQHHNLCFVIADGGHARFVQPASDNGLHTIRAIDSATGELLRSLHAEQLHVRLRGRVDRGRSSDQSDRRGQLNRSDEVPVPVMLPPQKRRRRHGPSDR